MSLDGVLPTLADINRKEWEQDFYNEIGNEMMIGAETMKTQDIVDISNEFGMCLTSKDLHRLAQTIPADDGIPTDYSDRDRIAMYLQETGITLDIISRGSHIWQVMTEQYGPIQGYSKLNNWPTCGFAVHGTKYLNMLLGSKNGPHLLVPHGYGYDWIDNDVCGGDGSGETRKALGI